MKPLGLRRFSKADAQGPGTSANWLVVPSQSPPRRSDKEVERSSCFSQYAYMWFRGMGAPAVQLSGHPCPATGLCARPCRLRLSVIDAAFA